MYILFAIIALGLIIFIHELGHYWMARRVGMKVEAFGIGFGKPLFTWERKGVKWNLCWIPFGGYVKIAGMEADDKQDLYTVPDGFFSKRPIDRMKVAIMGPVFNLILAFFVFFVLWMGGGRTKNFAEFTPVIGWVDPASELYAKGIRPGDIITEYGNHPFESSKDHLYAPMIAEDVLTVKGLKVNYQNGLKTPFEYDLKVYPNPDAVDSGIKTIGVLGSANYIIYNRLPTGAENPLPEGSPLQDSGIQYGDRILWIDGELVFSDKQLSDQALSHPTWKMGPKVTIDSSTLMNKGLEVIEAHFLFGVPLSQIDVVIHPQSIIHSMVEFIDTSIMAQMSEPSMIVPIQYAITYPHREKGIPKPFDFLKNNTLQFAMPDTKKFLCLQLAYDALKAGGNMPCYMNAANETLVNRFLNKEIGWSDIALKLNTLMCNHDICQVTVLDDIFETDALARAQATTI